MITMENKYKFIRDKHVHTLNGNPLIGVTTSLNIISKPLTWWASGMAVEQMGWINPKKNTLEDCQKTASEYLAAIKNMSDKEYLELLNRAYKAHNTKKEKAKDAGVDLHYEIERYIKDSINKTQPIFPYVNRIIPFIEWTEKNVERFIFSEAYGYSETMWVGGIADFGYIGKDGLFYLGDIKSSENAYFSHLVQCGAYDILFSENKMGFDEEGKPVFNLDQPFAGYSIVPFGAKNFTVVTDRRVEMYKRAYKATLALYKENQVFEGKMQ